MKRFPSRRHPLKMALFAFAATLVLTTGETFANEAGQLNCAFVGPIQGVFLNQHINYNTQEKKNKKLAKEKKELERRAIEQYIKRLDGSKLYFTDGDIKSVTSKLAGILNEVEKRPKPNCRPLVEVQELFETRVGERVAYAKKVLGKGFKFNKETKLLLDPDKRNYAKDAKALNEYQEKYIQFQISNFIAGDVEHIENEKKLAKKGLSKKEKSKLKRALQKSLDEKKEKIVRRYERNLRRVKDMDEEMIFSSYLDAFARSLDPHSSYFSADVMEDFRIQMRLSLEGIGATLSSQDGFTVVEQLIPGGAAARDGRLQPKDKIIEVSTSTCGEELKTKDTCLMENVIEMDLRDVVKKIRGEKDTKVRLTILRYDEGKKKRFSVVIVRDKVRLEDDAVSITYVDRKFNGKKVKVGVVNLPSFYADSVPGGRTSAGDLKKVLKEAKKAKVDSLVLDLSSNGGGSLDDAVKIGGLFFKTGAVVKQSAKKAGQETILSDSDANVDYAGPLVVLTSRISASASEIVAGTLQDYKRAVVVGGDHTFGKGSIQSVIPLPSGLGAAKVTVGMFYTPGGNSTQHRGVDADIVLPGTLSNDEVGEKTLDYSLPPSALAPFLSKSAYVTKGKGAWNKVMPEEVQKLRTYSQVRVANSEDFKKVLEDIKKNENKDGIIDIAETFKERTDHEEKKKEKDDSKDKFGNVSKEAKLKEYLKRADVQEAIDVAADLYALRNGLEIKIGQKTKQTIKSPAGVN